MERFMQCLKRISFLAYGYEAEDESFGIIDSAKVEFVNGLVLFLSKVKSICPSGHGTCTYGSWVWKDKPLNNNPIVAEFSSLPVKVEEDERYISVKDLNNREIIAVSKDGGDGYYPDGYIDVDYELLNKHKC